MNFQSVQPLYCETFSFPCRVVESEPTDVLADFLFSHFLCMNLTTTVELSAQLYYFYVFPIIKLAQEERTV
jgi:hypothetical protein